MAQAATTPPAGVKVRLNKYGYNCIARHIFLVVFVSTPLFVGAGTLEWGWAWAYSAVVLLGWVALSVVLVRENPTLLNQRGQRTKNLTGTKRWDWVILGIYALLLLAQPFVAGLDQRYGWSAPVSTLIHLIGLALMAFSFVPLTWSMAVNKHFEGTVRIQNDRDHQVIDSGPYRYVRHPGYVAVILQFLALPLAVGAWTAFIPGAAGILLFILRTALEDAALQRELAGYTAFTQRTRYRLLPGVW